MEYNESMNKIEEPYFDGIKRRYELIEKRIKDFHDKSRLTGTNSLIYTKDEFSPFLNNSPKEQIKENFELQKNLQNLQNVY